MLSVLGFDRNRFHAKIKKEVSWLRGRLPWPFSRKKQRKLVFLVHVQGDAPNEHTRHFFRRLITSKMRSFLAFLSFCLSTTCLGLATYVLVLGSKAVEFSTFVGLSDGIGTIPLAASVIIISAVQVVVHTVGSIQCFRAMSPTYRSDYKNKLTWMGFYSLGVYTGLVGMKLIVTMTVLYGYLANVIFRNGLRSAMASYGKSADIKAVIDKMQMVSECCGSLSYKEWWNISWIPQNYIDLTDKTVRAKLVDGVFITDDVPFSCCNSHNGLSCIHESMITQDKREIPSVYYVGCSTALKKILVEEILPGIRWSSVGLIAVLSVLFVVYRYLATSLLVARSAGNGRATSIGYLMSWRRRGVTDSSPDELYALITRLPKGRKVNSNATSRGASTNATSSPARAPPQLPPPMIVSYANTRPFASGPWSGRFANSPARYRPAVGGGWQPTSPYGYRPGFGQRPPYSYPNYGYHNKNEANDIRSSSTNSTSDDGDQMNNSNVDEPTTSSSSCGSDETRIRRYPEFVVRSSSGFDDDDVSSSNSSSSEELDAESPAYWTETGLRSSARSPIPRTLYSLERPAQSKRTHKRRRLRRRVIKEDLKAPTERLVRRSTLDLGLGNVAPPEERKKHGFIVRHSIGIVGGIDQMLCQQPCESPRRHPSPSAEELVSEHLGEQKDWVSTAFSMRSSNGNHGKVQHWIEHNQEYFISPVVQQFVEKSFSHANKVIEKSAQPPPNIASTYVRPERYSLGSSDQEQPLLSMGDDNV